MKLPFNLTMQKNQKGEFTDITFIFLAFTPVALLFLRTRRKQEWTWIAVISTYLLLAAAFFYIPAVQDVLTQIFGGITLPLGYLVMIGMVGVFALAAHYLLDGEDAETRHAKDMIFFLLVYGLIFWVSAFGIVWYGVVIYFFMLVVIGYGVLRFTTIQAEDDAETTTLHAILSILLMLAVYFVAGAFPHTWKNLLGAGYNEYKYDIMSQDASIFTYRSDYIGPIATMNLLTPHTAAQQALKQAKSEIFQKTFTPEIVQNITPQELHSALTGLTRGLAQNPNHPQASSIKQDIDQVGAALYKNILYPPANEENTKGIYRIGTFMTYLINKNRERYYEDSLVFNFENYFYDPSPELAIQRMQKMGLGYLLVDLNAATIDQDPRHALTTRYEHLLSTMRAKNLTLVDTDNVCLRFALDMYHQGDLPTVKPLVQEILTGMGRSFGELSDADTFLMIAGTNYESYREVEGHTIRIQRGEKSNICGNILVSVAKNDTGASTKYPYLASFITEAKKTSDANALRSLVNSMVGQSWFVLFEIQDTPTTVAPVIPREDPVSTETSTAPAPENQETSPEASPRAE